MARMENNQLNENYSEIPDGFSPDNYYTLSGSQDQNLIVFDLDSHRIKCLLGVYIDDEEKVFCHMLDSDGEVSEVDITTNPHSLLESSPRKYGKIEISGFSHARFGENISGETISRYVESRKDFIEKSDNPFISMVVMMMKNDFPEDGSFPPMLVLGKLEEYRKFLDKNTPKKGDKSSEEFHSDLRKFSSVIMNDHITTSFYSFGHGRKYPRLIVRNSKNQLMSVIHEFEDMSGNKCLRVMFEDATTDVAPFSSVNLVNSMPKAGTEITFSF